MGLNITSDLRTAPTGNTESITPPPTMTTDMAAGSNQVNEHNSAPQAGGSTPTDGGREATTPRPVEDEVNDRLNADPEYQELKAKFDALKQFESDFSLVDAGTLFGRFDNIITLTEVMDVAADLTQPQATRDAAQRILNNRNLWNQLAAGVNNDNDNRVGMNDVGRLIGATGEAMTAKRNTVRDQVNAERAPKSGTQSGTPAAGGSGGTGGPSAADSIPRPSPSKLPGIDGALENLSNAADNLQARMMALANDATEHPEKATAIGQQIAMLNNQLQAITNMMNQLTQMISNMSKMWSDVSMNSIRNLR